MCQWTVYNVLVQYVIRFDNMGLCLEDDEFLVVEQCHSAKGAKNSLTRLCFFISEGYPIYVNTDPKKNIF